MPGASRLRRSPSGFLDIAPGFAGGEWRHDPPSTALERPEPVVNALERNGLLDPIRRALVAGDSDGAVLQLLAAGVDSATAARCIESRFELAEKSPRSLAGDDGRRHDAEGFAG